MRSNRFNRLTRKNTLRRIREQATYRKGIGESEKWQDNKADGIADSWIKKNGGWK